MEELSFAPFRHTAEAGHVEQAKPTLLKALNHINMFLHLQKCIQPAFSSTATKKCITNRNRFLSIDMYARNQTNISIDFVAFLQLKFSHEQASVAHLRGVHAQAEPRKLATRLPLASRNQGRYSAVATQKDVGDEKGIPADVTQKPDLRSRSK